MTKDEHLRLVTFRSKFLEHAKRIGNVSATCRYFGISREKFYKWKKRFDELGAAGLGDRPRRPHRSPNETPRAVVSKVLYLRQNYHFGAGRIRDYLKRFHGIRIAGQTVQNILHKHRLGRLPANQKHQPHSKRWQRYEKPLPGHRVQMDVKFLERIPGTKKRLYQFTAIDDCTRIRVLKIYDKCNQTASVDFANEVVRRLPFRVLVVQTDNGSEFGSHFHWHLESLDIRHVRIRPRTPRLNGKVERSHRIDNDEFYRLLDKDGVSDDIHLANKRKSSPRPVLTCACARAALGTMTLIDEANEIRSEVEALRKGPGRKYSKALRERVLSWLRRADDEGLYEPDWLQLGIPLPRLMAWRDEEKRIAATVVPEPVIPRPTESTSLVPVAIRDDGLSPFGPMISFSAPGGYTISGLTLDQAIGLLRLFG